MAWLRSSPIATCTEVHFSPSATASGICRQRGYLAAVKIAPAVSSCGEVAGTVLGGQEDRERRLRASSSIASTPRHPSRMPIS